MYDFVGIKKVENVFVRAQVCMCVCLSIYLCVCVGVGRCMSGFRCMSKYEYFLPCLGWYSQFRSFYCVKCKYYYVRH